MSDHALLGWLLVLAIVVASCGLVIMIAMLREAQRFTRAVAALVYQESDKTRAFLTGRPPFER